MRVAYLTVPTLHIPIDPTTLETLEQEAQSKGISVQLYVRQWLQAHAIILLYNKL